MRKRSAKRAAKQKLIFGPQSELCRLQPCCACGKLGTASNPIEPHHEPTVRMGGLDEDTCPLCRYGCHNLRHGINGGRPELERRHNINLRDEVLAMRRLVGGPS